MSLRSFQWEDKRLPGHSPTQCEGRRIKKANGSETSAWLSVPGCSDGLVGPLLGQESQRPLPLHLEAVPGSMAWSQPRPHPCTSRTGASRRQTLPAKEAGQEMQGAGFQLLTEAPGLRAVLLVLSKSTLRWPYKSSGD